MRNAPFLASLAVLVAVGIGFCRARVQRAGEQLPAFAPPPGAQLDALNAPLGSAVLAGRVVDIDGEPAADVTVYVRSNNLPLWTRSDAQGRFRLEGLAAGPHDVALVKWGYPPRTAHLEQPGEGLELTLAPPKPPPSPLPSIRGGALSGRVAHPLGDPYADPEGYELQLEPRADITELQGAVLRRVRTDARGFFALEDLAHGDYRVRVVPSWAESSTWPDLISLADAQLEHAQGSADFVVFGLDCGAIETTVVDAQGAAVDGAFAVLVDAADATRVWPPRISDAFGVLRFVDLPAGAYRLSLRAGESPVAEVLVEVEPAQIARPQVPPLVLRKR